ncbi:MAG: hypothetical protein MRERV_21c027 [Mycoplasmataceae bacterium RV_VA103A]|nr:MAG: hypothetical protein MRERV_21c027 [Mycoplasmataceae bacterium RV_VA103A]
MSYEDKNNPINIGFPLSSENRKKYQEGVDYCTEDRGNGFRKYIILSEKLKADFRRFNNGQDFGDITEQKFEVLPENSEEMARKIREENEKHQQKFIAENNPPKLRYAFLTPEDELWNEQQIPLTSAEKNALNDPILEHCGDWERTLWFIQKNRQACSDAFPDENFAWDNEFMSKMEKSGTSEHKARQALKNAGISLDKLFEKVEKGRKIKEKNEREKPHQDEAKILANIEDWEIRGEYIYNSKTGHWKSATNNMWTGGDDGHPYYSEYEQVKLTPETYQEVRQAIFNRFLKKLRDNKQEWEITDQSLKSKKGDQQVNYEKDNFTTTEWAEIEREIGNFSVSKSHKQSPNNSTNRRDLIIIISLVGLIILSIGLLIVKKRLKKNDPKR